MSSKKQQLSLINPDLSGLWSSNHLVKQNDTASLIFSTVAVSMLIYPWVCGFIAPIVILLLMFFQQWKIAIALLSILLYPYFVQVKQWTFWQRFMMMGCNYFKGGVSTSFEFETDFSNPILLCLHPHGLFCFGVFYNGLRGRIGVNDEFTTKQKQYYCGEYIATIPNIMKKLQGIGLIDNKLLNAPIFKHIVVGWLGGFASAEKKSIINIMKKGENSGFLVPGGFNEASLLRHNVDIIYIKKRKGFIKYALKYGYAVLPGYTFGECCTYRTTMSGQSKLKTWLTNHNIPCVLPHGPGLTGFLLPYNDIGLHTIYGNIRKFPKREEPTNSDIEEYHAWYVDELKRIFNDNKWRFGMDDKELMVV